MEDRFGDDRGAPEREAGHRLAQTRQCRRDGGFDASAETGYQMKRVMPQDVHQVGRGGRARGRVQAPELFDGDRARLEQPAQIGGQVGNRRLDDDPSAAVMDLTQPGQDRFVLGRTALEKCAKIRVGGDAARLDERESETEQTDLVRVTTNPRERGQVLKRSEQREHCTGCGWGSPS